MTKDDFILQAMLQMTANPKYVTTEDNIPTLNTKWIVSDAESLAEEAEENMGNLIFD